MDVWSVVLLAVKRQSEEKWRNKHEEHQGVLKEDLKRTWELQ